MSKVSSCAIVKLFLRVVKVKVESGSPALVQDPNVIFYSRWGQFHTGNKGVCEFGVRQKKSAASRCCVRRPGKLSSNNMLTVSERCIVGKFW